MAREYGKGPDFLNRRKSGGGNAFSPTWKKNIVESITSLGVSHSHYSNTDSGSKTVQFINGQYSRKKGSEAAPV